MSKTRGFEVVETKFRQHKHNTPSVSVLNRVLIEERGQDVQYFVPDIILPSRADPRSAGYDFHVVSDIQLLPMQKTIIYTDVKAYMQEDEVLEIYIRSSLAIKSGIMLSNNVGIIDSSYYSNEGNDGNIGIALVNTSGTAITLKAGDRVAQGVFKKYLITDDDNASGTRIGGIGSSGR